MELRQEKNKELYKKVNAAIASLAEKTSNENAEGIENVLEQIDPDFFGQNPSNVPSKNETSQSNKKIIIITCSIVLLLFVLIIMVAVVMS